MANFKRGWRLLLIKAALTVLIVFIIENICAALVAKDPAGLALMPFHNHYFSFSRYYLTSHGLGSEFSSSPSATTRFVIYALFGYLIYAVLSILAGLIPGIKKYSDNINTVLFFIYLLSAFLLALFISGRLSIIDRNKKEIRVTDYTYGFIPSTKHISFSQISTVADSIMPVYDGYNKLYVNYLIISVADLTGAKTELGAIEAGKQKGTFTHKPAAEISREATSVGARAVNVIRELIK